MRYARDWSIWRHLEEAYVQQWTSFTSAQMMMNENIFIKHTYSTQHYVFNIGGEDGMGKLISCRQLPSGGLILVRLSM